MGYEQLSTVIVLVIVLIGIVVWLPVRTAKSMRHVEEHREDRYSSSLHLVDGHSGTRFSDDGTYAKGVLMQPNERRANTLTPERIAQVRRQRHQAVRRRRILVSALLAVTIVVAVIAFPLHFSPWFALIPAALVAAVLALGARAARQARAWERKVARAKARSRRSKMAKARAQARTVAAETAQVRAEVAAAEAATPASDGAIGSGMGEDTPTAEMERREIRRVLRQAEIEQHEALVAKGRIAPDPAAPAVSAPSSAVPTPAVCEPVQAEVVPSSEGPAPVEAVAPAASGSHSQAGSGDTPSAAPSDGAADAPQAAEQPSDATAEVAQVRPAAALDAFDMATTSQDLISFSLGEARNTVEERPDAPESREIKSMRQVAKATPVDADEERALAAEAKIETAPAAQPAKPAESVAEAEASDADDDSPAAQSDAAGRDANDDTVLAAVPQDAGVSDVAAFHESEEQARVAVPAATSDSLGNDLQTILARRGS